MSPQDAPTAYVVGGSAYHRTVLPHFLRHNGIEVPKTTHGTIDQFFASEHHPNKKGVILLSPHSDRVYSDLRGILRAKKGCIPVVALLPKSSRSIVQSAMQYDPNGCVDMGESPTDILEAVEMVSIEGGTYFSQSIASTLAQVTHEVSTGKIKNYKLSGRELDVIQLMWEGQSSKQIARTLHRSPKTIEHHRASIYRKTDVDNIVMLMKLALKEGIVTL
jgi:DNA-binding NarL/FixJ family response regulator